MNTAADPVPDSPRAAAADTALVLVNLGTPDAPTAPAVRRYLSQFLHDRRVVDMTRWLWCPLLHFVILPIRGRKVAAKYASVWIQGEDGGSPLAVYTRRLARAVQAQLPGVRVLHAMRYGRPALDALLAGLQADGVRRVLVLPLYPQYSTSTTAAVADVLDKVLAGPARERAGAPRPAASADTASPVEAGVAAADVVDAGMLHAGTIEAGMIEARLIEARLIEARLIDNYHLDPGWIAAVADSIRDYRARNGAGEHLLFSLHGLPQRFADRGDPYPNQCQASTRAIAAALGLDDHAWTLSYQSRFGREPWLAPATTDTLAALGARGVRTIDVVAPGFAVDCLETLEEVAMLLAEEVAERGGQLRYIPCLNDSQGHARALAAIAMRELGDWQ